MKTYAHGFPQIGENHEFCQAVKAYMASDVSGSSGVSNDLAGDLARIDKRRLETYGTYIDIYATGELTRFDAVLDTAVLCGLYDATDDAAYYGRCVGENRLTRRPWFTTNRSYLVPDFRDKKPGDLRLALPTAGGADTSQRAVLPRAVLGPFTLLRIANGIDHKNFGDYLHALALIYRDLAATVGPLWIHEPGFALEVTQEQISRAAHCYETIAAAGADITLFTYYDDVDFLSDLLDFPVAGIGLDFIGGDNNLTEIIERGFPTDTTLLAGLVDGRSIWRTGIDEAVDTLAALKGAGVRKLMVGNGAPLYHLPVTTAREDFDIELDESLAFATERLQEIATIAEYFDKGTKWTARAWFSFEHDESVRSQAAALREDYAQTSKDHSPATVRNVAQAMQVLPIVAPPGAQLDGPDSDIVPLVGTDNPTELVERAVDGLKGVVTTKNGYVLTHGISEYRPPIIVGDIARQSSLSYATKTDKPLPTDARRAIAIIPGPMTITGWSYVRTDVDPLDFAYQAAIALRSEVEQIEARGVGNILIEELGLGGMAPAKRREWFDFYSASAQLVGLVAGAAGSETLVHLGLRPGAAVEAGRHMGEIHVDGIVIGIGDELELVTRRILRSGHRGLLILQADETTEPEALEEALEHLVGLAGAKRIWLMVGCTGSNGASDCAPELIDRLRPAIEHFRSSARAK